MWETLPSQFLSLVHVVEPVDEVEEGEGGWEYNPRPAVNGIHVRQVGDLDLELRRPPAQSWLLQLRVALQALPGCACFSVLHAGAIGWRRCRRQRVPALRGAGSHLVAGDLVVDFQGGQQDVSVGIHLGTGQREWC